MRAASLLVLVLISVYSCKQPPKVLPTSYYGIRNGAFDLSWDLSKSKFTLSQYESIKSTKPMVSLSGDVSRLKSGFHKFKVSDKGNSFYGLNMPSIGIVFGNVLDRAYLPMLTGGSCLDNSDVVSTVIMNNQDLANQARTSFVSTLRVSSANVSMSASSEISLRDLSLTKTGPVYSQGSCNNGLYEWSDNNVAFFNRAEFGVSRLNNNYQLLLPQSSFNMLNLRGTYKGMMWSALGNTVTYLEAAIDSFGAVDLSKYDGVEQVESGELNPKSFAHFTVGTPNLLQSGVFVVDDFSLKGKMSNLICSVSAYPNSMQIRVISCVGQDPDDVRKSINFLLVANN